MIQTKHVMLPLVLGIAFLLEGTVASVASDWLYGGKEMYVPRLLFILLLLSSLFLESRLTFVYAGVFGFFYDLMYTEVIGIYTFGFPVIVYIVFMMMKNFQSNVFVVATVSFLGIIILEYYTYTIFTLIDYTQLKHDDFLSLRLIPTMILNAGLFVLIYFPMRNLFTSWKKRSEQK
ncbi:MAG: rod shape-determining protein MreD [Bacilli bacterium]